MNYALVRIVPPSRHEDRSSEGTHHRCRSARGAWSWHWRNEAGQRNRCRSRRRPRLLFHWLPAETDTGSDDRGCLPRRGDLCRRRCGAPSGRGRQAGDHRQLPGRLADHDDGGDESQPTGSDHAGRLAVVVLGGRARKKPASLSGWRAGWYLADRTFRGPGQRHIRRRQSGCQLRIAQPGKYLLDQGIQRLFEGGYGEPSASSISRPGGAVRFC